LATIERIEFHDFTYPVLNLEIDAHGNAVHRDGSKIMMSRFGVVIRDSDGATGAYFNGGYPAIRAHAMQAAPLMLGRDVGHREKLYDDCKRALRHIGSIGYSPLDCALWDLTGKRLGQPVHALLGTARTRLPTYASTFHGSRGAELGSKEAYADFAERCLEMGYRAFKVHGWSDADPREEAENVVYLAQRMNGRMDALMLDPACELRTFADALRVGRACDEAEFFWFEDPFRDGGLAIEAHRKLKSFIRTPLLMTEHVHPMELKVPFITGGATDFVRANPDFDLGITGTMKIAHLAEAFGLDVELHGAGPAQRQCMAAIRNTNYYELTLVCPGVSGFQPAVYSDYSDDLEAVGRDGCFPLPEGPGLGVELDEDFLKAHTTNVRTIEPD
jgi:L-alanine-DL-glutamate epimerase-like enolase superfamily enzyme